MDRPIHHPARHGATGNETFYWDDLSGGALRDILTTADRGSTPSFGLFGDVPLDRVWIFFGLAVLNRVYLPLLNRGRTCSKQGMVLLASETLTQTASSLFLFLDYKKLG